MEQPITLCKNVAEISTEFELNNSELKRKYYENYISVYNFIALQVSGYKGTFGTGYPFYALNSEFEGPIPIIDEQIRYNNELIESVNNSDLTIWKCASCIKENGQNMPDLKTICKPCPNMDHNLKPRKVINRLPDLDMWMVCNDNDVQIAKNELAKLLLQFNIHTSDKNPLQTIKDLEEINKQLKMGIMPHKFIPIDTHIIEYNVLYELIEQLPYVIKNAHDNGFIPYLPIHPLSYRKTWQYDDTSYNFVHDFLSSLKEYDFDKKMHTILTQTRYEIANNYSLDELYNYLIQSGPDSVLRRHRTKELKNRFEERVNKWKK